MVLNHSPKKYQKDFIEKAIEELEQLKTYVRTFFNGEEMVIFEKNFV